MTSLAALKRRLLTVGYGVGFRLPWLSETLLLRAFSTPFPSRSGGPLLVRDRPQLRERWYRAGTRFRTLSLGEGPPVLLVHGWGGSPAQMLVFAERVAARGFEAVMVELPAHGLSEGRTSHGFAAAAALTEVVTVTGPPHAIIAHSFGALATRLGLERGLETRRLVFVAPMPSLPWAAADFARKARVSVGRMHGLTERFARSLGGRAELIDLKSAGPHRALPLLVVHDRGDRTVPLCEAELVVESWPGALLEITDGLGHSRILEDAEVASLVVRFALDPVETARSGS